MARDMEETVSARLRARFEAVRARTLALAAPFSAEDLGAQAMDDASPGKWHLGHTTWFWETFLLKAFDSGHKPLDPGSTICSTPIMKPSERGRCGPSAG